MEDIDAQLDVKGPFENVFIQECEWMNRLLREMVRSLAELSLGFAGELTMTDAMESLMNSLYMDRVPGTWSKLAYPSKRGLASWLVDLGLRLQQLSDWTANPTSIPKVTWLSGMVN